MNCIDWFCIFDLVGKKFGFGGGIFWLFEECYNEYLDGVIFGEWFEKEKRIFFYVGG